MQNPCSQKEVVLYLKRRNNFAMIRCGMGKIIIKKRIHTFPGSPRLTGSKFITSI